MAQDNQSNLTVSSFDDLIQVLLDERSAMMAVIIRAEVNLAELSMLANSNRLLTEASEKELTDFARSDA
jgi:hypothetical protein